MQRILLVEPENPENTGFVARLAANFCFELELVNPCFNLSEARKTANNAQEKLRDARIHQSFEQATEERDFLLATKPSGKPLSGFKPRDGTTVVLGPESSGLERRHLEGSDATASIVTPGYDSLNQSHAAAVLMNHFSLTGEERSLIGEDQKEKIRQLAPEKVAESIIAGMPTESDAGRIIRELQDW